MHMSHVHACSCALVHMYTVMPHMSCIRESGVDILKQPSRGTCRGVERGLEVGGGERGLEAGLELILFTEINNSLAISSIIIMM